MQKIKIKPSRRGSLHSALGIKPNALIPERRIQAELHGNPDAAMKKKLVFAENAKKWGKGAVAALALGFGVHSEPAHAQDVVVPSCGAITYPSGQGARPGTQTTDGKKCISGTISAALAVTALTNTQAGGAVTTHGTFQQALAVNAARNGCTVQNTSADTEFVYFGATGSATTANSYKLAAGQSLNCAVGGLGVATDNVAITSLVTDGATFVTGIQ